MRRIRAPLTKSERTKLKCGESVLLTGTIYTARDAAHKKLNSLMLLKKRLPFELKDTLIYYAGPTPARHNGLFGSCGPTTASRMDKFTPALLKAGLGGTIGKGRRSQGIRELTKKTKTVYFIAVGGAGAYLAKRIKSLRPVAFKELGPEAVYKIVVKDFPLIVGIDSRGRDVYS